MDVAEQYEGVNYLQRRDAFDFLTENIEYLNFSPGDVVLDIGCGPGNVTANILLPKLPNNIGHLVGGDLSEDMVRHATDNFAHPKLSFTQLDIATKTLDLLKLRSLVDSKQSDDREYDGIFDKIFSFYCLNWVEEQKTRHMSSPLIDTRSMPRRSLLAYFKSRALRSSVAEQSHAASSLKQ